MQNNELITNIAVSVFSCLATYAINFSLNNKDIIEKQYFQFVSPAFEILDDYFKSDEEDFEVQIAISKVFQLAEENKSILGGDIRKAIHEYKKSSNNNKQETFMALCKVISIEHDRMSILLSIKPRDKKYKQEKGQYYKRPIFIYYTWVKILLCAIMCTIIGISGFLFTQRLLIKVSMKI